MRHYTCEIPHGYRSHRHPEYGYTDIIPCHSANVHTLCLRLNGTETYLIFPGYTIVFTAEFYLWLCIHVPYIGTTADNHNFTVLCSLAWTTAYLLHQVEHSREFKIVIWVMVDFIICLSPAISDGLSTHIPQ